MDNIEKILDSLDQFPNTDIKREGPTDLSPNDYQLPDIQQSNEQNNINGCDQIEVYYFLEESIMKENFPNIEVESSSELQPVPKSPTLDIQEVKDIIIPKKDPFPRVFKTSRLEKNENAIRYLIRMAVEYFPEYRSEFEVQVGAKVEQICQRQRNWRLEDTSKNNYNLKQLPKFFSKDCQQIEGSAKKCRQIFHRIICERWRQAMDVPKSQIINKVQYLRVAKVFKLRCRSQKLTSRTQSR